jgi:hypothetical protein
LSYRSEVSGHKKASAELNHLPAIPDVPISNGYLAQIIAERGREDDTLP